MAMPPPEVEEGWITPRAKMWLQYRRHLAGDTSRKTCEAPAVEASGRKQPLSPRATLPTPVASQRYRRPHILHVEIGDLVLNADDLALELAWYETARYFVSLHPSSVRLPAVQWPREAPCPKPNAKYAEYMACLAQPSKAVKSEVYDKQELVQIHEKLEMQVDGLDSHLVLFLWCQRSSLLGDSTVLLGYRPIPLRDVTLYSRWAAWDISDLEAVQELAQLSIRLTVTAPPGQIRLAHLSDVKETGFTLNWSEPLGSPATAYAVSIHTPGAAVALSRQTTSGHEVSLDGLLPGKTYIVDITGMNQAGWGDGLKLEASTRPSFNRDTDDKHDENASGPGQPGITHL